MPGGSFKIFLLAYIIIGSFGYYHNVICYGLWPYFRKGKLNSPCFLCSQRVHGDLVLGNEIHIKTFVFWKREQRPFAVFFRVFLILETLCWIKNKYHFHLHLSIFICHSNHILWIFLGDTFLVAWVLITNKRNYFLWIRGHFFSLSKFSWRLN